MKNLSTAPDSLPMMQQSCAAGPLREADAADGLLEHKPRRSLQTEGTGQVEAGPLP